MKGDDRHAFEVICAANGVEAESKAPVIEISIFQCVGFRRIAGLTHPVFSQLKTLEIMFQSQFWTCLTVYPVLTQCMLHRYRGSRGA